MKNIHSEIKRWGNSLALVIPAESARELELSEGIAVDFQIRKCRRVDSFGILKGKAPFQRERDEHDDLWSRGKKAAR